MRPVQHTTRVDRRFRLTARHQTGASRAVRAGWFLAFLLPVAGWAGAQAPADSDPYTRAMRDELGRSMAQLRIEGLQKPYFISYRVDEIRAMDASARFGVLVRSDHTRRLKLDVEVRVGDYELDNTNFFTFSFGSGGPSMFDGGIALPLDGDYREIRRQIWLATDKAYKKALENFSKKQAALQNKKRAEEIPDFSREEPTRITGVEAHMDIDRSRLEELLRELSAEFREQPDVFTSSVRLQIQLTRTRYINSEGTAYTRSTPLVSLTVRAATQAEDGMPLEDFLTVHGRDPGDLPPKKELIAAIRAMGKRLAALRHAPILERYNGPVLFEGQAAAEAFAQVLAPKLLASRQPVLDDPRLAGMMSRGGGSLEDKIGARVTARLLAVKDDPTRSELNGSALLGGYEVDDEGVPARETSLIERGMLRTLLAGRTPVAGVLRSTGSRRGTVMPSNMIVSANQGMTPKELKQELLLLVEERQAEFGVLVRRMGNPQLKSTADPGRALMAITGGGDQDAVEQAIEAYKVYADGREELIRNVTIKDFGPGAFKEIVAASAAQTVYTAPFQSASRSSPFVMVIGGPGGGPLRALSVVSWVVPSLLFEDLTLKRPSGEVPNLPVTPRPVFENAEQGSLD